MPKRNIAAEIKSIEEGILDDSLKNSREERRANGRMVALIVALFLIFLAIYHAWLRKIAILAGAIVPALIMILYGCWVVFLTKREKERRLMLEQKVGEKLSEKGSEFSTLQKMIVLPIIPGAGPIISAGIPKPANVNEEVETVVPSKKKRRHKRRAVPSPGDELRPIMSKWDGRSNLKHHILGPNVPTEAITKLRQERRPLCRTCSAP